MSYSEKFNLSWNEFDNCTSNTFKELLGETDFVDVTLVSDDLQQIKAHKVILSASSSVLKKMLQQNPQQHPIIYLSGIDYKEMCSMISFIYLGQTEVEQDSLNLFMEVAAKFDVKGLKQENKLKEMELKSEILPADDQVNVKQDDIAFGTNDVDVDNVEDVTAEVHKTVECRQKKNPHYCEQCEYESNAAWLMKRHVNAVHNGVKFPCDQCDYKSSFSNNLKRHKKMHSFNKM